MAASNSPKRFERFSATKSRLPFRERARPEGISFVRLGALAWPVNIVALLYGVGALLDMLWPRTPTAPWYLNYSMGFTWLVLIGIGALYMLLARPYDAGTAPAGDAWKLAEA